MNFKSRILGCYFHLNQAIFRKLKKITQSSSLIKLILAGIKKYKLTLWSLSNVEYMEISGRTNNASSDITGDSMIFFSHTNLASFVSIIKDEFLYHSEICKKIRQDSSNIHFGQGLF
ncbi:LOW QUALITY PROTEIN: hypothetical protein HZS_3032 [Henneguya salminicola]|nr:LOW QUALITY PROTEIN: hypothetical protein HZS_3032 [Henneguya salminicola]